MQEKYLPKDLPGKYVHLTEECAEVIKALSKIQRFGLLSVDPKTGVRNVDALEFEMADLKRAFSRIKRDPSFKLQMKL